MAADKQANIRGTIFTVTKLVAFGKLGLATTGDLSMGIRLMDWYRNGAKKEEWPANLNSDGSCYARLIVGSENGCSHYETSPYGIQVEDKYAAYGSGMDAALGALYMGANAKQAVEAAIYSMECCGRGVTYIEF